MEASERVSRVISVQNEMLIAMEFIRRGLAEQRGVEFSIVQKFFVMYNLAQGFERYLKLAVAFMHMGQHGSFPTRAQFMGWGHGIQKLLDRVVAEEYSEQLLSTADGRWGQAYLSSDPIFCEAMKVLSKFGQSDRYYDMDVIGGMAKDSPPPDELWEELEAVVSRIIFSSEQERMQAVLDGEGAYEKPVYELTAKHLEWGLYAISRAMIIGETGNPTIGWPQHFMDYVFKFGPPYEAQAPYR